MAFFYERLRLMLMWTLLAAIAHVNGDLPLLQLRLGSAISPADIREGSDIYFDCIVSPDPPVNELQWSNNGHRIEHDPANGVIVSNQSLVIQNVRRQHSGTYVCILPHVHSFHRSNPVEVDVKFAPVCQDSSSPLPEIRVRYGDNVSLVCNVTSNPPALKFEWWNSYNDDSTIPPGRISYTEYGRLATYSPKTKWDYSTLGCMATNEVGHQRKPCFFKIIPAENEDLDDLPKRYFAAENGKAESGKVAKSNVEDVDTDLAQSGNDLANVNSKLEDIAVKLAKSHEDLMNAMANLEKNMQQRLQQAVEDLREDIVLFS